MANPLTRMQAERNAEFADAWSRTEPHRQQVTGLLVQAANEWSAEQRSQSDAQRPRLGVLGAGNANDLDLKVLAEVYREITLVDIDGEALARAVAQQGCQRRPEFVLHPGCDITGVWPLLAESSSATAEDREGKIEQLRQAIPGSAGLPELGPFDVVASACVLSQLVEAALRAVGEEDSRSVEIAIALRLRHFRLMAELLEEGGRGLLVTDFVSSDTNPALPQTPPEQLPEVLGRMLADRNCFTALHPGRLTAVVHEDAWLRQNVRSPGCLQPWLWNLGPRHYAVTAIPLKRVTRPA